MDKQEIEQAIYPVIVPYYSFELLLAQSEFPGLMTNTETGHILCAIFDKSEFSYPALFVESKKFILNASTKKNKFKFHLDRYKGQSKKKRISKIIDKIYDNYNELELCEGPFYRIDKIELAHIKANNENAVMWAEHLPELLRQISFGNIFEENSHLLFSNLAKIRLCIELGRPYELRGLYVTCEVPNDFRITITTDARNSGVWNILNYGDKCATVEVSEEDELIFIECINDPFEILKKVNYPGCDLVLKIDQSIGLTLNRKNKLSTSFKSINEGLTK